MTVALRDASYSEASWRPAVRDRLLYRTTTKNDGFAIPTDLRGSTMHARTSSKAQQARIEALQAEVNELQSVLGEGENAEQIVSRHIKSLHQYNEAKDAAQILRGRLAAYRHTTIRQVHSDFGLTDDD